MKSCLDVLVDRNDDHLTARTGGGRRKGESAERVAKQPLTARECSMVKFIAKGQSDKQIARTLGATPETLKTQVKRIFVKLSAETRAQAIVRAQSLGFLRGA